MKLPEIHGVGKELDLNIQPEKKAMRPIAVTKVKEGSQIKPRLGQGRTILKSKIKIPVSPLISKPIAQVMEKQVKQPKVPEPKTSRIYDKIVPDYTIPHISSGDDLSSRIIKRKTIQDVSREIPL